MSQSVTLIAKITARPEAAETIAPALLKLAAESRKEAGCTSYAVVRDIAEPHVFALVEEWVSVAALDAHNTMPHVHEALSQAGPLLAKPPEIGRYRNVS